MEHIAAKLNMDPIEFRTKNLLKEGDMLLTGDLFKGDNPLPQMFKDLEKSGNLAERKANLESFNQSHQWKKRGLGVVPVRYNIHAMPPLPFYCQVNIYQGDGSVSVAHGGIEMGQGINTKVAQTVAKELGVPMELVVVKPADAFVTPNNSLTGKFA